MVTLLNLRSDCLPCDLQDRVVRRIEQKYQGRVAVVSIDAERFPDQAKEYEVIVLPTLIFYDAQGSVVHRMDGGYMKQNAMEKIIKGLLN